MASIGLERRPRTSRARGRAGSRARRSAPGPAFGQARLLRADIFNRGFGGYTSALAVAIVNDLLPPAPLTPPPAALSPALVTIFFGANDATAPDYHMVRTMFRE